MDFIEETKARGFFHQCTDEAGLREIMKKPIGAYIGFDATADSLHIGSLVQIMMLRLLERHGHKAHMVIGSATTKIGDPSFRDAARPQLDDGQIQMNRLGILNVFQRLFDEPTVGNRCHDNLKWFKNINYLELLADVGSHFSVNRMIGFDSVKTRLDREQGLSFLEFNYAIMQSYDFRYLARWYDDDYCPIKLQMGGSDQWGNIVSGIELIRKTDQKTVYGLTAPLITMANGEKMGKSAGGAVWLSENKLSPYDYWQFWRNVADADVGRFLRLFTELDLGHIAELEKLKGSDLNAAKIILANEATQMAHGISAAQKAAKTARETFEENKLSENLPTKNLPKCEIIPDGIRADVLFVKAGLATSNTDARRLIEQGGAKIDNKTIDDGALLIFDNVKLSAGKKRHVMVKFL